MQNIGFIGLGVMGLAMAQNLAKAGYALTAWNRTTERFKALADWGAVQAKAPSELGQCQVVFVNVSDDAAVAEVLFGPQGLVQGLPKETSQRLIVVDMGTTSPSATRDFASRLSAQGVAMLDAPVSGGMAGAQTRSLSIMVGGDEKVFQHVRPLFQVLGRNIVHVGGSGAGQIAKVCNQIVVSATLLGVAEAFNFAQRQGVDPARVREALLGGSAYSRILEVHGKRMLDEDYQPGFRASLHKKDLDIVLAEAVELGIELKSTPEAARLLDRLVAEGNGDLDSSALFKYVG